MNRHDRLFVAETDYIPCWVWASAHARNATTDEEIAAVLIREELWLQSEVFSSSSFSPRLLRAIRGFLPFDSQVDSQRCGRWWTRGWMCGVRFVIRKQSQIRADGTGSPKSALQAEDPGFESPSLHHE